MASELVELADVLDNCASIILSGDPVRGHQELSFVPPLSVLTVADGFRAIASYCRARAKGQE